MNNCLQSYFLTEDYEFTTKQTRNSDRVTLIISLLSGPKEQSLHQVLCTDTATLYNFMLADYFFMPFITQIKPQVFLNARRQKELRILFFRNTQRYF